MKKILLVIGSLAIVVSLAGTARACGDGSHCACKKAAHVAAARKAAASVAARAVRLEGKVVAVTCDRMVKEMEKVGCTGAALAVGGDLHMIKKAKKGLALVRKAKGTDKVVQVTGQKQGEFLTVETFTVRG